MSRRLLKILVAGSRRLSGSGNGGDVSAVHFRSGSLGERERQTEFKEKYLGRFISELNLIEDEEHYLFLISVIC